MYIALRILQTPWMDIVFIKCGLGFTDSLSYSQGMKEMEGFRNSSMN